jgi:hypothetical protein
MPERPLRLALAGALAGMLALLGLLVAGPTAAQAPVGPLTFSSEMTAGLESAGHKGIAFASDNNGVYVTFTYSDLPQGSTLSRIVRLDGEDYNWDEQNGALSCCPNGGSGRYGFPIVKRDTSEIGQLPGGSYEVLVYLNGSQAQVGGFVIGSGDSRDDNENNNDNQSGDDESGDNDDESGDNDDQSGDNDDDGEDNDNHS